MVCLRSRCRSWLCLGIAVSVLIGGFSALAGEADSSTGLESGRRQRTVERADGAAHDSRPSVGVLDIPWCGTQRLKAAQHAGSAASVAAADAGDCSFSNTNPLPIYDPSVAKYRIPIVVHVIQNRAGMGYLNEALIQDQIALLNEGFLALPGTSGAPGTDVQIEFYLATQDPYGHPTNGITYSTNDAWFKSAGLYWESLAWNPRQYPNIYANGDGSAYPSGDPGRINDGIVETWLLMGRDDWTGLGSTGTVLTHEMGHYFALEHTLHDGCDPSGQCYTSGDLICDTNPHEAGVVCGEGAVSVCGAFPTPEHNYMNHVGDACATEFTLEQARRMRCFLESNHSFFLSGGGVCGDGTVQTAIEDCEPPNTATCDARCQRIPSCGDGILEVLAGEVCDDGNNVAGNGCSPTCQFENVGNCCTAHAGPGCGNAQIEACVCVDFPGCCTTSWDTVCAISAGQTNSTGAICGDCSVCGDGNWDINEECEPPNTTICDANCKLILVCGNMIRETGEQCDDGNTVTGDGCDSNCQLEGLGDCCTYSDTPGCSNAAIQACVCAGEPACCTPNSPWNYRCIDLVDLMECAVCRNGVCGNGAVEAGEDCEPPNTA